MKTDWRHNDVRPVQILLVAVLMKRATELWQRRCDQVHHWLRRYHFIGAPADATDIDLVTHEPKKQDGRPAHDVWLGLPPDPLEDLVKEHLRHRSPYDLASDTSRPPASHPVGPVEPLGQRPTATADGEAPPERLHPSLARFRLTTILISSVIALWGVLIALVATGHLTLIEACALAQGFKATTQGWLNGALDHYFGRRRRAGKPGRASDHS